MPMRSHFLFIDRLWTVRLLVLSPIEQERRRLASSSVLGRRVKNKATERQQRDLKPTVGLLDDQVGLFNFGMVASDWCELFGLNCECMGIPSHSFELSERQRPTLLYSTVELTLPTWRRRYELRVGQLEATRVS